MKKFNEYTERKNMIKFFKKRTDNHIRLVQKYCKKIEEYDPKRFAGLIDRGEIHDKSKYEDPEMEPYINITWGYRCKENGIDWSPSEEMKQKMSKATESHVRNKNNRHHPESTSPTKGKTINRENRDKPPEKMIDATNMTDLDIGEMVADWWAMSEEKKDSSPKKWADSNVNIRWKFTKKQVKMINNLIENI